MKQLFVASFVLAAVIVACGTQPPTTSAADAGEQSINPGDSDAGTDAGTSVSCGGGYDAGTYDWTLAHDGKTRTFRVVVPSTYDPTKLTPVVFNFHGYTSYGTQQEWISGMDAVANQYGFIVVYADGLTGQEAGVSFSTARSWNAGNCCMDAVTAGTDDIGFVKKMVDQVKARFCVDPKRVYSAGFSNGAMLSQRIGCELADRFAAIGPVAGPNGMDSCDAGRPMPILAFHGTKDPIVPYNGNTSFISQKTSMDGWAQRNGCDADAVVFKTAGDVTCAKYPNCSAGADTELCTVADGGHEWPGGQDLSAVGFGYTTQAINASQELWLFFDAHPMP